VDERSIRMYHSECNIALLRTKMICSVKNIAFPYKVIPEKKRNVRILFFHLCQLINEYITFQRTRIKKSQQQQSLNAFSVFTLPVAIIDSRAIRNNENYV